MTTIGIITSGNDAPGMNCAIRAVTRAAIYNGLKVKAIYHGYKGLIEGDIVEFQTQSVSNIIQYGGTILKSSPSKEFKNPEGRKKAYENLIKEGIDALIVIGGDGTIQGARIFASTTTSVAPTLPLVMTRHSTPSCRPSIRFVTLPPATPVSSLSK